MRPIRIFILITLILTMVACTLSVNVPEIRTGITETKTIKESANSGNNPLRISIQMGAGTLNIHPGGSVSIEGTVKYNVMDWEPKIVNSGDLIEISQANTSSVGIPNGQIVNFWDLQLGSDPMELIISTGANEGSFNLSGLAISRLSISDGASKTNVSFTKLNPVVMEKFEYHTGASEVTLKGLGFARMRNLEFYGGAGSYHIDLTGELLDDMNVKVSSGMSDVTFIIPNIAHTIVSVNGGISNINANGTWTISGNHYESGTGSPVIKIDIEMAVGNLNLIQQ